MDKSKRQETEKEDKKRENLKKERKLKREKNIEKKRLGPNLDCRKIVESKISKFEDMSSKDPENVDIPPKWCMEKEKYKITNLKRKFSDTCAQNEVWEGEGRPPIKEKFTKRRNLLKKLEAKKN